MEIFLSFGDRTLGNKPIILWLTKAELIIINLHLDHTMDNKINRQGYENDKKTIK